MTGPTTGAVTGWLKAVVGALLGALFAALLALAVAPAGATGLYVLTGIIFCGAIGYGIRADLAPLVAITLDRLRVRRFGRSQPLAVRVIGSTVLVICAVALAIALAGAGTKTLLVVLGILAAGSVFWLCWPCLHQLMTVPSTEPSTEPSTRPTATHVQPRRRSAPSRVLGMAVVVVASAVGAWIAAPMGIQGLLAVLCAIGVIGLLVYVKNRSIFFTFASVCSLTFVLHKSFGPQDLAQSGGAISIYVTTFDLMLLVLYGIWMAEGTLLADVKAGWSNFAIWIPLAGAVFLLPSLLVAPSLQHAAAELFRMLWMYLLYFYFAVRIRSRQHVWAVLGGLAVFAVCELVVVVLQWTTGGVLGLSFLGVPTTLGDRTTDVTTIGRPFGTMIHPVFMGAVLGSLGLIALALAIELQRSTAKLVAVALVPVSLFPLYVAQTRASLVAVAIAAVGVIIAALVRKRLQWSTIRTCAIGVGVAVAVFFPQLENLYQQNFGTNHYGEEVASRLELNEIAGHMISDHWLLGVGLNNFGVVEPAYEPYRVIFFGNPVHNLYLLFLAETGIVGFVGVLLVGVSLYNAALRLARSRDRLLGGVGIGVAGAMAFLLLEELLGFSLRQDIPLALFWLLGGLAVSCRRLAGPQQRRPRSIPRGRPVATGPLGLTVSLAPTFAAVQVAGPTAAVVGQGFAPSMTLAPTGPWRAGEFRRGGRRTRRTSRRGVGLLTMLVLFLSTASVVVLSPTIAASTAPANPMRITFTAIERATGVQGIFTSNGDGTAIRLITPADGRFYNWPRWAFGGSKIVFTVRTGSVGSPVSIEMMNSDGSDVQLIQHFEYRVGQPSIDPTGRWLTFTGQAPWFAEVAIFRMDLRKMLSTNLTALTSPLGGFDSDPTQTRSGDRVVFATSDGKKTAIELMNSDGTNRQMVTHDHYFNADPDVSPDNQTVVTTSYRGPGNPSIAVGDAREFVGVHPGNWHLVLSDLRTGSERVLTAGQDCTIRTLQNACTVPEMSTFASRFAPDGKSIGFTGALDNKITCICTIDIDGSHGRAILLSADLAIDWFDWVIPSKPSGDAGQIGSAAEHSKILLTLSQGAGANQLVAASADLMHRSVISLPKGLTPDEARWSPDRRSIVFAAKVSIPRVRAAPHPDAPVGSVRRVHFTLSDVDPAALAARLENRAVITPGAAREQVFLRTADGGVRQLTDPWIEDWQDGVSLKDARANANPTFSPDGRYVLVTNTSTTTGESFVLRIDLGTGAVLNLTNATSGALPVADSDSVFSPDGNKIAFAWTKGRDRNIYLMNVDGSNVTQVTSESFPDSTPAWLPDGSGLIFTSERPNGYVLVKTAVPAAGRSSAATTRLTDPATVPIQAVLDPAGTGVAFVGFSTTGLSVFLLRFNTGSGATPHLLQPDPVNIIHFADWR